MAWIPPYVYIGERRHFNKLAVTTARRLRYAARRAAKSSRISGGAPPLATVRNSCVRMLWCDRPAPVSACVLEHFRVFCGILERGLPL